MIIALDIDGTITYEMKSIPDSVVHYLSELHAHGWTFIFITGRTFDFGYSVLQQLPFPYYYAVQNGAILFEMPTCKILTKIYLDKSIVPGMEKICEAEPTDFVVYAGFEYQNHCFFREKHFSQKLLRYLEERRKAFGETWISIHTFDELPMEAFPSIKCFGEYEQAQNVAEKIESVLGLHVPVIKDPFSSEYYVVQATHPRVSKGEILRDFINKLGSLGPVIAAGDDLNDLSMFEVADYKIAMENAPTQLKEKADFIAPPASVEGIIIGLKNAIQSAG